ncbi:hypothetical protein ACWD4O_47805 [Streptomyces sp. NPDC002623]
MDGRASATGLPEFALARARVPYRWGNSPHPVPRTAVSGTPTQARRCEDGDGFEVLVLAPVVPLAAHSAVSTVDPRKVIATVRGSEVAADPTNALALEASRRRSLALAADPRSNVPVRLAATQRVARAQSFNGPRNLAHFQLFGLVTAGRDGGNRLSEHWHLAEHLRFAAQVMAGIGAQDAQIRLTILEDAAGPTLERMRHDLAGLPGVEVCEDSDRATGRGYYTGI